MKLHYLFVFFVVFLFGCTVPQEEISKVEFIDISKDSVLRNCFVPLESGEWVINSKEEYEAILQHYNKGYIIGKNGTSISCKDIARPVINFSEKTLIGKSVGVSGCGASFDKNVYKDTKNKKIIYEIKARGSGFCMGWFESYNWILIPKIPEDYKVEFKLT